MKSAAVPPRRAARARASAGCHRRRRRRWRRSATPRPRASPRRRPPCLAKRSWSCSGIAVSRMLPSTVGGHCPARLASCLARKLLLDNCAILCVIDGPRVSPSRRRQAPEQEPRASQRSLTRGWWGRVGRAQIAIVNSNAECAHLGFAGVFEAKEWSARGLREHRFHTITFSHPDVGLAAGENARGGGHGW